MTRDEAIQRAEVAMAWAKGEAVQHKFQTNDWFDAGTVDRVTDGGDGALFFKQAVQWRVKPKPLVCWVWVPDQPTKGNMVLPVRQENNRPCCDPDVSYSGRWVRMEEKP